MQEIINMIDERLETLEATRKEFLKQKSSVSANQMWARMEELKKLQKEIEDKFLKPGKQ